MAEDTATQEGASVHERLMGLYTGEETPPNEEQQTPVEDVEATDEQVDVEAATGNETEDTDVEGEVKAEEADEAPWMPESVTDLAEALEVDPSDLLKRMRIQTKVDGEIGEATLEEVVKTHQLEKHLNRRSEQLAQERKEAEERFAAQQQEYEQKAKEADDTLAAMEQLLVADYQSVNWKELQEDDPTQYLIAQQGMQQRFSQLQAAKQGLDQKRQDELNKQQEEGMKVLNARKAEEGQKLASAVEGWTDPSKFNEGMAELTAYLQDDVGFVNNEWAQVFDHRAYVLARKAMLYDRMQKEVAPKKQQLKSKPKFVPPGARKSVSDAKAKKVAELRKRSKRGDKTATHELLMMKFKR